MRMGYIGAGRVGCSLASFFLYKGYPPAGFASRSAASAQAAAQQIGGQAYSTPAALANACDVVWITTPDDAIAAMANELAGSNVPLDGKRFCHVSGAASADVLRPLLPKAAGIFAVHPIYTFAGRNTPPQELEHVTFTVEGEGDPSFLNELLPSWVPITAEQKPLYHAGLCVMSNYMATLLAQAARILEPTGIPLSACRPLLEQTLHNITTYGAADALTGPISRGDAGTIRKHIRALGAEAEFYQALGRETAAFALQNGRITHTQYKQMMEALDDDTRHNE